MESFVIEARRHLHEYPEVGFELDKTLEFLRSELDKMGVEYTEKYGKSSIVATINPEKTNFTIGIRADIDALPVTEETDLPFKSKNEGKMHACGHDAHTAIALDTCRRLSEMRDKINCRVKILFQAAEEGPSSGAKLMALDGVMKDIDCIVSLHCDTGFEAGELSFPKGPRGGRSDGFHLEFYGKTAHAANQHQGVDAIMMAVKAYTEIEFMVAKEIKATEPIIFNVGAINGGVVNNIICDKCTMYCTLRTHKEETALYVMDKIKRIIAHIADISGGDAKFIEGKCYPIVMNDERVMKKLEESALKLIPAEKIKPQENRGMGGEDFSYFTNEKPGGMLRLGVKNEALFCTAGLHNSKFMIDESCLELGSSLFVQFVLDNMNGIDLK